VGGQVGVQTKSAPVRPPDYESAKVQADYQEERAQDAERPGLTVPAGSRRFSPLPNLRGYQYGYQWLNHPRYSMPAQDLSALPRGAAAA